MGETTEERLKQIEREKRELKAQLMQQKEAKKRARQDNLKGIEEYNEKVKNTLNKILKAIYLFNKLSKGRRYEHKIFQEIQDLINQKEVPKDGRIDTENRA